LQKGMPCCNIANKEHQGDSMDSSTVFMKTARGIEEIASRSHGLSTRLRGLLIMIDGRRSVAALLGQSPMQTEAESHLAELLDGGFIAPVSQAPATEQQPASAPAAVQATSSVDIGMVKQYINTTLHSVLGPDADMFSVKVDAARNAPELLALSEKLVEVIRGAGSKKKADEFKEKVSSLLS
jgi:hypothetical protein